MTSKKQKNKSQRHSYQKMLPMLLGVVIIGLITWAVVAQYQHHKAVQKDAAKFAFLQKQVDDLGNAVKTQTNPDKSQAVQYCDYASREYGRGPRSCYVDYYLQYSDVDTMQDAQSLSSRIEQVAQTKKILTDSPSNTSENTLSNYRINGINAELCSMNIRFYQDSTSLLFISGLAWNKNVKGVFVAIDCSDTALADHFRVIGN